MPIFGVSRQTDDGHAVAIDCPACGASGVSATPQHFRERLLLLGLIPLFPVNSVFLKCGACGRSMAVDARDLDEFYGIPPAELSGRMRPYVSGVGRFFVVAALALFWMPFLAPVLAVVGLLMTRRNRGWRRAAVVALVLSLLVLGAVIALFVLVPDRPGRG
jgi:hypothetical protein